MSFNGGGGYSVKCIVYNCYTVLRTVSSMYYVCMYSYILSPQFIAQSIMDQPCKVANPARGELDREDKYSPVSVRA